LDGVMENPAWTMPYWNDEIAKAQGDTMEASGALLLGRVTYQGFAAAWPKMAGQPGADKMNSMPKHVASRTLKEMEWNAELIQGDVVEGVKKLKEGEGPNLLIYGSADLIKTLMEHDLIDEYRLLIYPVVVGSGKRLFADGINKAFKLTDAKPTSSGVIITTYQRA
jgi:dihydrofolate reductase